MICLLSHHALMPKRYEMAQMDNLDPVRCPCGFARRAFASAENTTATLHIVDIQSDSKTHYHKKLTEIYLVLEGQGEIELDGETFPCSPHVCHHDQAWLPTSGHWQDENHECAGTRF